MSTSIGIQDARAKGIEWVRSEYVRLKEDLNRDPSYCNVISIALSELEQEQEQEGREQKQVEHIDGFIDVVQQVFEALFPEETYSKLLGLTEYEDKRQDFYKLVHATYAEKQKPIFEAHNLEIAAKDEKIQALTKQGLEVQGQLDKAIIARKDLTFKLEGLEAIIENGKVEDERLNREKNDLLEQIAQLQTKLEQATKPKEPVSGDLQSLINSVKIKSINDLSAAEMEQRFLDRMNNGGKVMSIEPPSIGGTQGNTFRLEDIPGADQEAVVEESFRSETESLPEAQSGTDSADHGGEESAVGENAVPKTILDDAFGENEAQMKWALRIEQEIHQMKLAVYGEKSDAA